MSQRWSAIFCAADVWRGVNRSGVWGLSAELWSLKRFFFPTYSTIRTPNIRFSNETNSRYLLNSWDLSENYIVQQGAPVQFIKSSSNSAYPYTDLSYTEDIPVSSGWFLCCDQSADTKNFTPIQMITEILSNEEELRLFCKQNQIGGSDDQYQK